MRPFRSRSPGSRTLALLFAAVLLPPALALVWLGATLLSQDRAMLAERRLERQEAAADVIARTLALSFHDTERWLAGDINGMPVEAVRLTRSSSSFDVSPADRVLWVPDPPVGREAAVAPFQEAERAEFHGTDDRGLAVYLSLARSPDLAVRAGALLRLARTHRRDRGLDEALRAYRDLARVQGIVINNTPVDLVARRMICEILSETSRQDELAQESASLTRDLFGQRWLLDRAAFELAFADVKRFTGKDAPPASQYRHALSVAADWVVAESPRLPASGRRLLTADTGPVIVAWQTNGSEFSAVAMAAPVVDTWLGAALERDLPLPVQAGLVTESGQLIAGEKPASDRPVTRPVPEFGLPWTLLVGPVSPAAADAELIGRRRLLGAGLVALVLLIAGGSYLLWRVVQRELAVARLQADFVAAVSHEFRTPLTSLRHISGLLEESDDLPPDRRQALYGVLSQSTERLHRLVESLLDFARMEDGRKPWSLRSLDVSALVTEVVTSFRREHPTVTIQYEIPADPGPTVQADADALTHALWNLLDNAVKYSPDGGDIHVSVTHDIQGVAVAVRDRGLGIPADERQQIFQRFVRGRHASSRRIAGTGLGLAMVSHIVDAHGGRIDVDSEEGQGSTFTIVLPSPLAATEGAHDEAVSVSRS